MKKNITLKVGALSLLVMAGFTGLIAQMPDSSASGVPAEGIAPWYYAGGVVKNNWMDTQANYVNARIPSANAGVVADDVASATIKAALLKGNALDLYKSIATTGSTPLWQLAQYTLPFGELTEKLMPGVFTSFDNVEEGALGSENKLWSGKFFESGDPGFFSSVNTPMVARVDLGNEKYGLGVMATKTNTARTEFLISTRGLTHVDNLEFQISAMGDASKVNRKVKWHVQAEILPIAQGTPYSPADNNYKYGLSVGADSTFVDLNVLNNSGNTYDLSNKELELATRPYNVTLHKSASKDNNLDNKVIRIICWSDKSVSNVADETNDNLEPVTVFSELTVNFARPHVTFSKSDTKTDYPTTKNDGTYTPGVTIDAAYEAGAGRWTKDDTLYIKVNNWNPVTDTEWTVDSLNQAHSPLKLEVAYPFKLTGLMDKDGNNAIADLTDKRIKGVAGEDSLIVYYIDRAKFSKMVREYTGASSDNEYKTFITYKMAPQHVQTYNPADYIKATVIAASADTARLNMKGCSLPELVFAKDTLIFDDYTGVVSTRATYKNLPDFALAGTYEIGMMGDPDQVVDTTFALTNNALWLENDSTRNLHGDHTNRFSDIVYFRGWGNYSNNTDAATRANLRANLLDNDEIDITGAGSAIANFYYNREDVNVDNPSSFISHEVFKVAKALSYTGTLDYTVTDKYAGTDFRALKDSYGTTISTGTEPWNNHAIVCEQMTIHGDNQYVWYTLPKITSPIANALTQTGLAPWIDKFVAPQYKNRVDLFFAPYIDKAEGDGSGTNVNKYGVRSKSRQHTIMIKASNLIPDKAGSTIATIKVFKQKGYRNVAGEATVNTGTGYDNTFYYGSDWKNASFPNGSGNSDYQGYYATNDTLYFKIDLNDEKLVKTLKNEGLPMYVFYWPETDAHAGGYGNNGWLENAVQFGILTNNGKAYNEFWATGITDRAAFTNIFGDVADGSFESFVDNVTDGFNYDEHGVDGIYRDMFKKSYSAYYIGQDCYSKDSSAFFVSGMNLIAPVKFNTTSYDRNSIGFEYEVIPVTPKKTVAFNDTTVANYGYLKDGMLYPNRYGELLVWVKVKPKAVNVAGLISDTVTTVHNPDLKIARNWAAHNISLSPVQSGTNTNGRQATYIYTYDIVKTGGNSSVSGGQFSNTFGDQFFADWAHVDIEGNKDNFGSIYHSFFDTTRVVGGATLNANVAAPIMKPQLYYAKDAAGKELFTAQEMLEFGKTIVGTGKDSTIYVVGVDLAHYGTGYDAVTGEDANSIPDEVKLSATGAFEINGTDLYTVKIEDVNDGVQDGHIVVPVTVKANPDEMTPCDRTGSILATAMCEVVGSTAITLNTVYDVDLAGQFGELKHGDIGASADGLGNKGDFSWTAVPGATHYKLEIGHYENQKTSEDVFISEFAANDSSLIIELFNGTGKEIAKDIKVNYYIQVKKDGKEILKSSIDGKEMDVNASGIKAWGYVAQAFRFMMDLSAKDNSVYTVNLLNGARLIDTFFFDKNTKGLSRIDVEDKEGIDRPISTKFNIADWETINSSLPEAKYAWETAWVRDGISAETISLTIRAFNLKPNMHSYYIARLWGYTDCCEVLIDALPFDTSISSDPKGDVNFDGVEVPTGNEDINASTFAVTTSAGTVHIANAAGKRVVINNMLGQRIAEKVLTSDDEAIASSNGVVIVAVEGEKPVKKVVK